MDIIKKILFIVTITTSLLGVSQNNENPKYNYFDAKTYLLYTQEKWDSLIYLSKLAIDSNNLDSYYFRVRYAVALFNKQKYIKAIEQFKYAKFYQNNDFVKTYLYYSYKYAGFDYKADELAENFPDTLRKTLKIKNSFLKSVDLSYSNYSNLDYDKNRQDNILTGENMLAESSYRKKNNYLISFGSWLRFSKSIKWYFSFDYLNFEKEQKFQNKNSILYKDALSTQFSVYNKLQYNKERFSLSLAYNYLNIKSDYYKVTYFDYSKFDIKDTTYASNDYSFNIFTAYRFDYFSINADYTLSGLNKHRQNIYGVGAIAFPFGNKNLYLSYSVHWQDISQKQIPADAPQGQGRGRNAQYVSIEKNTVQKLKIGLKLFNPLWFEASSYFGRMNEYSELAYYVYNETTPIKQMYSGKFIYLINSNLQFFVKGTFTLRENNYYNYNFIDNATEISKYTQNFNNLNILGGLKWDF